MAVVPGDLTIHANETVVFDGSPSTDNEAVVNWTWFFIYEGNDRTLYGESVTFRFEDRWIYHVQLTVRDAAGLQNSTVFLVTVDGAQIQATHPISPWVWSVAAGAFIIVLLLGLGLTRRAKPARPSGEDPYHLHP